MRDAIWLIAFAALPLFGLVVWRFDVVRRMDLAARISIAFAAGLVFVTTVMFAYALAGIEWTRVSLTIPLAILAAIGVREVVKSGRRETNAGRLLDPATGGIGVILLLILYGIATTRETCADLIYFWGPKGQRFWMAGTIDVGFLGFPHYSLMHADYPPLIPSAYAFASIFAHHFSWWGALYTMLLFLAASAFALRGFMEASVPVLPTAAAQPAAIRSRRATWYALLLTAVLAYCFSVGMVAGAADPALIFLETVALCALTFGEGSRGSYAIAGIAMAGLITTKVEGAVFASVTFVALLLVRRGVARAIATVAPAILLLAVWIAFCAKHNLLDSYKKGAETAHWELTGSVILNTLRMAAYKAFYLPWLASLGALLLGRNFRRAALPLIVAAGSIAYTLFFYLHIDVRLANPAWWIASSAERVLLTPLMALVVAAAAASE